MSGRAQGASLRLAGETSSMRGSKLSRQINMWTLYPNRLLKLQPACSSSWEKASMMVESSTQSRPAITPRLMSTHTRAQKVRKYTHSPSLSRRRYNWLALMVWPGGYPQVTANASHRPKRFAIWRGDNCQTTITNKLTNTLSSLYTSGRPPRPAGRAGLKLIARASTLLAKAINCKSLTISVEKMNRSRCPVDVGSTSSPRWRCSNSDVSICLAPGCWSGSDQNHFTNHSGAFQLNYELCDTLFLNFTFR